MANSSDADSLQLSPVSQRNRVTSLVRSREHSRQSEVYCNVRHMLSYIDQVEGENYRHVQAIEDQFQTIKHELYRALRGERPVVKNRGQQ